MSLTDTDTSSDASKQAMQQVLKAEQEATLAVQDCHQQAKQILHLARERVRQIKDHTDERISLMHLRQQQHIDQQLKHMQHATEEKSDLQKAWKLSDKQLQQQIDELAKQLISTNGHEKPSSSTA